MDKNIVLKMTVIKILFKNFTFVVPENIATKFKFMAFGDS